MLKTIFACKALQLSLTLVFSLFFCCFSYAKSIPSYDLSNAGVFNQPFDVYVFEDDTQSQSVDAIAAGQLGGYLATSRFHVKSTNSNYWLAFTLLNQSPKIFRRIIRVDEPYIDSVSINYKKDGEWYSELAGLRIPISERKITNRNPVFQVTLAPHESKTIYIHLHSNYGMLPIGLMIEEPAEFVSQELVQNAGYFFYFGAAASLLIYNFFLFITLRDKLYIYYVMHGLCFVTWVLLYSGFDLYLGVSPEMHYKLNPTTSFTLLFLSLFTRSLLQTKKNFPRADMTLKVFASITLFLGILCFIDFNYYQYLSFIALITYIFFLIFGIYAVYKRTPLSIYYLSSMTLYFIGIITLALFLVDIAPHNFFTRYFYLIGSLAEFSIFSLALAYRIKLLQRQNLAYQENQIQAQIEAKNKLEEEVSLRTKDLKQANEELAKITKLDGLTGLGNRRLLDEWITHDYAQLKEQKGQYSVILCDIDFFKKYNDFYGHQKGDTCLRKVATALKACCHQPDDLAIRYGGEEFLILLSNTDKKGASKVAARIQFAVNGLMIEHYGSDVANHVTLSQGVASSSNEAIKIDKLISIADELLYKAKGLGRNQYCLQSP